MTQEGKLPGNSYARKSAFGSVVNRRICFSDRRSRVCFAFFVLLNCVSGDLNSLQLQTLRGGRTREFCVVSGRPGPMATSLFLLRLGA